MSGLRRVSPVRDLDLGSPLKDGAAPARLNPAGRLSSLHKGCVHLCVCLLFHGDLLLQQPELGCSTYDISLQLVGGVHLNSLLPLFINTHI